MYQSILFKRKINDSLFLVIQCENLLEFTFRTYYYCPSSHLSKKNHLLKKDVCFSVFIETITFIISKLYTFYSERDMLNLHKTINNKHFTFNLKRWSILLMTNFLKIWYFSLLRTDTLKYQRCVYFQKSFR